MKKLTLALPLFLLLACGRVENSSSQDRAIYSSRSTGSIEFEAAAAIILPKCSECHASWTAQSEADYIANGLIVPQNPNASKVYYRNQLGPGPDNNMPSQGRPAMTAAELQTIANWINSI
jgi:uncharacterized membrane protein